MESILPYFGGAAGEECRVATVEEWKVQNSTLQASLDAVIETELYNTVSSYCQNEIDLYNRASATVCLLEKDKDYNLTYTTFWDPSDGGGFYLDGKYDLATMFAQTSNFTDTGEYAPCLADCYTGQGDGCEVFKSQGWMINYGKVPVKEYCDMHWYDIDNAFNAMKLCAMMTVADPSESTITKKDMVGVFQGVQATEGECAYKYCIPKVADAIETTICPASSLGDTTNSGASYSIHNWNALIAVSAVILHFMR